MPDCAESEEKALSSEPGPELFFGLVGAVGTNLEALVEELILSLNGFGYQCQNVRLSSLLSNFYPQLKEKAWESEYERIDTLMTYGDTFRKSVARADALAVLACADIRHKRDAATQEPNFAARRAFVLNSLKRPEEVKTLREIYGRAFYLVAACCPRDARVSRLAEAIGKSGSSTKAELYRAKAEELVLRDSAEEEEEYGQRLSDTFPLADVFVSANNRDRLRTQVDRFIKIVFGDPFTTPTRDEYGMFHAKAAALRSADLSRQVGAAIASGRGEIIAVGSNDVPKYGGGLYWFGDEPDDRDFKRGRNPNREVKEAIVSEMIQRLQRNGWFRKDLESKSVQELTGAAIPLLARTRVLDIAEFGRTVHAEMAAIVDAAFRGVSVSGGTLYATTFPCHMCAKHIVAAGIKRVVYMEPYPKSMAPVLHSDSIVVDTEWDVAERVAFEPFVGISPRQYIDAFTALPREDAKGKPISIVARKEDPRYTTAAEGYLANEERYWKDLAEKLNKAGLQPD